jgi:membrane-bound ClpP family serine protease
VSDWNQDHSLAKARINTSQEPVLEMDISTYGGLSKDSMQSMVSDFFGLVKDFNKALNQKVGD